MSLVSFIHNLNFDNNFVLFHSRAKRNVAKLAMFAQKTSQLIRRRKGKLEVQFVHSSFKQQLRSNFWKHFGATNFLFL